MPSYYNRTRGPLPLSLPSGSTIVGAKSYVEIAREDEGCGSVSRYVRKGFLVPPKLRPPVDEAVLVPQAPEQVSAPAPEPESEEPVASEEDTSSKKKSRKRTKR